MTAVKNSRARTNRRFSLLGACGLLAITVIQVPGLADLWEQARVQNVRRQEIEAGSLTGRSAQLEQKLLDVMAELNSAEQAMVGSEMMPTIQSELMEMAKNSNCQLRKAVIQAGSSESWEPEKLAQNDDELDEGEVAEPENSYSLSTEQLSLSLTGTLAQIFDFLERVRHKTWLMRVAQINFSRDPESQGQLSVEANLAFYKLVREAKNNTETVQWREGSRASKVQ